MESLTLSLSGEDATRTLGRKIAAALASGDFVGLAGPLGAGKTVLARALCEALGVPPADIASPSFAIVNAYQGRVPVFHADLYRLANNADLHGTGLVDLVGEPAVLLVEWIDRAPWLVPADALLVTLEHASETSRRAVLEARGARGAALLVAAGS